MKKLIYLFILGIGFSSCSVESFDSTENLLTVDAKFSTQSTVLITPPVGKLCVGEDFTFSVEANTSSNFQVQQLVEGVWEQVYLAKKGLSGTDTFEVVLALGENFFRHTNQSSGSNWTTYSSSFIGVVCDPCENLLTAELVCGDTNTLTVTFTAVEEGPIVIQGGLTNGTTITTANSAELSQNTTHNGVENSNANVTRWEGDLVACEEVSITISFTGGNGIGDWSAKRGDEVLGTTKEQECNND